MISAEAKEMRRKRRLSPALCQKRRKYLGTYYIDDLEELSMIAIGSLSRFVRSSEWFLD